MAGGEKTLLERGSELDEIAAAVSSAAEGAGGVVVIEGEAGIGKTTLLEAARALAADQDLTPLTARGSQLERGFGFGVVRQLFQAPVAALPESDRQQALSGAASLAASLLTAEGVEKRGPGPDVFALLHGLHWLCANLAVTQPLLLAVDDVQWSDENSLRFLAYLAGRIDELPVLMLATLRTGEPDALDELLRELRTQPASKSMRPVSLSLDGTVSHVRGALGPTAEGGFCAACHESTAGNPLLLSELVRALAAEGVQPVEGSRSLVFEIGAKGVSERLLSRIDQISPAAVAVARAVSTLEPHASLRRTAQVAALSDHETAAAAHALVEAGVLGDDEHLVFMHPLLRSAVEGSMTMPQRSMLALRAAQAHLADGSAQEIVASHVLNMDNQPQPWAIDVLGEAADSALARGAPASAVSYLRRAVNLAGEAHRAALNERLGSALLRATDAEGIDLLLQARSTSEDRVRRAELAHELSTSLVIRSRPQEAEQLLRESIAELGDGHRDQTLTLRADLIQTLINTAAGESLREEFEALMEFAGEIEDGRGIPERLALQALAIPAALGLDRASTASRLAMAALRDEDSLRESATAGLPLSWACLAAAATGKASAALALWQYAVEETRRRGSAFGMFTNLGVSAMARLSCGQLEEAEADVDEAMRIPGLPLIGVAGALSVLTAIRRERGQAGDALRGIAEAGLGGRLPPALPVQMLKVERGLARLESGLAEEALDDLAATSSAWGEIGAIGPDLLPASLRLPLAIHAAGDANEAVSSACSAEAWARETENPRFLAEACRVRGLLDPKAGPDALRASVELLEPTEFRLDLARANVDLGAALRRAKERRAAREPLRDGMELAHRCGATALEERARTELEATGARPRSVIVTGAESLTPSERRVAQLAADGMTNREIAQNLFVTAKTVETHLRHCYQKLEIASRRELSSALSGA